MSHIILARGEQAGHIRVAFLQADMDLTYKHPFVESCPTSWPFDSSLKIGIANSLKCDTRYDRILNATKGPDLGHLWSESADLPSWSEHRRQRILRRVIDCCEAFAVDLLVLPEYSVRQETIPWLKSYLAKKKVAVLAGTYMNFGEETSTNGLSAPLTLLWPLPEGVSNVVISEMIRDDLGENFLDPLRRGLVFAFTRHKKYRSIALEEFFQPSRKTLAPLFDAAELNARLKSEIGAPLSSDALSHLLASTRLPLKHLMELICSEIFLVSSPANYSHMQDDFMAMQRRFGSGAESDAVIEDVKALCRLLGITGDGFAARRSILAVPAGTSRSADYWIAGQANFLAAGTTTVFCNGADGKTLVGGSCFIGRGSWKSDEGGIGYIERHTPYHGWSKGIFYNDKKDALSNRDQAVVIADIDPHNSLDGKPRAQTMPPPLQLVAYLPVIETVSWQTTQTTLLRLLSVSESSAMTGEKVNNRAIDDDEFWQAAQVADSKFDKESLNSLWGKFKDPEALSSRMKAYSNNGGMQPAAMQGSLGLLSSPALYDWVNVNLTLTERDALPIISVPAWKTGML